jgi:hypothetical protein
VERNEALFFICQMAWAKFILKKLLDWFTITLAKNITIHKEQGILRGVLRFPNGIRGE